MGNAGIYVLACTAKIAQHISVCELKSETEAKFVVYRSLKDDEISD